MKIDFILRGLVIGFSIAAPVGPIGVLCIRRTLAQGRLTGLVSGLGAATADAFYGAVAAFGLTMISNILIRYQNAFRFVGGLFLCYLGVKTFFSPVIKDELEREDTNLIGSYSSTFILTITNPMTIISFAAIFAGIGLIDPGGDYFISALIVLGVFLGSAAWWLGLSTFVGILRNKFSPNMLRWTNRLSAGIIVIFGIIALSTVFGSLGLFGS